MIIRVLFTLFMLALVGGGGYGVFRIFQRPSPLPIAAALEANKDPRAAQAIVRRVVRDEPRNAEAHMLLARTQLELHDAVAAEKEFRIARALRYDRTVLNPLLARALLQQERFADVLTEVPPTAMRTQELVSNLVVRSLAYLMEGDVREAETSIEGAVRLSPTNAMVLVGQARVAIARRQPEPAAALLDQALATAPDDAEAWMLMGDVRLLQGRPEDALEAMSRAVTLTPFSVPARLQRAVTLMRLGRDADAVPDVARALEVDRNDSPAMLTQALLFVRLGRYVEAAPFLQRLIPVIDKYPRVLYLMGLIAMMQGQDTNALNLVTRYTRVEPSNIDGVNLAATVMMRLARTQEANALLTRTVESETGNAQTYDLLGRSQFILGQTDASIASYRRANAMDPNDKEIASHLLAAQTRFGAPPDLAARLSVPDRIGTAQERP